MNINDSDHGAIVAMICSALILISLIIGISACSIAENQNALNAGLHQEQNIGTCGTHWTK